jgi:Fur family ferric uptake transcriptional regulator
MNTSPASWAGKSLRYTRRAPGRRGRGVRESTAISRPDDLLVWARAHHPRVSRATIYRTLELLVSAGLVRQMTFGDKSAQHYEQVLGIPHHDHLICLACGRVQEVFSADLEREQDALCARHGFEVHHPQSRGLRGCAGAAARPGAKVKKRPKA